MFCCHALVVVSMVVECSFTMLHVACTHLLPDAVCSCHAFRITAVDKCSVGVCAVLVDIRPIIYEPRGEKTGFLHMRKQRRRSASG